MSHLAHHQPESSSIAIITTTYILQIMFYIVIIVIILLVTIMIIISTGNLASLHVPAVAASRSVHGVCGVCADAGVQHPLTQWHDSL